MPKTSDIKLALRGAKLLFKGRPNTRKTVSYASFPGRQYVFMFDPDGISPVVKHFPERSDIEYDYYHSGNLEKAADKIRQLEQSNPFDIIVLDSLTFGADSIMRFALDESKTADKRGHIKLPGFKEFNCENNEMLAIIGAGFRLASGPKPATFIVNAHVMEKKRYDDKGNVLSVQQRLVTGGEVLADKILGQFKELWHFSEESEGLQIGAKMKYYVHTKTRSVDTARTNFPLPERMDITDKFLYDVVKDELGKKGLVV